MSSCLTESQKGALSGLISGLGLEEDEEEEDVDGLGLGAGGCATTVGEDELEGCANLQSRVFTMFAVACRAVPLFLYRVRL